MQKDSSREQERSIVVSNTSPPIALKYAELIDKLGLLFQRIIVPPSVMRELNIREKEYFQNVGFLLVEEPKDRRLATALKTVVDEGEAEAITLALEKGLLLIIDDLKGRKLAKRLGASIIGTLGLLKAMKLAGLIDEIKPPVERLKKKRFYISDELIHKLLSDVGEV